MASVSSPERAAGRPRLSCLTLSLAAALFCLGAMLFVFGPCLTAMSETFRVPLARFGLLWTCYAMGLLPAVLLTGYFADAVGRRCLLLASVLVLAASCGLFAVSPAFGESLGFPFLLAVMALFGVGAGGLQAIVNATLADDNQPSPGFAINLAMAHFAAGAMAGPAAASALLRARLPWDWLFVGLAVVFGLLFAVLLPQRMPRSGDETLTWRRARALLGSRALWLLILVVSLYTGAEVGFNTWIPAFLERTLGAPRGLAGVAVSAFWGLMIVGRIAMSFAVSRYRLSALLLILAAGGAVGATATAASPSVTAGLVGAAVTGLFMSGINGLVLTEATHSFARHRGAVFGLMCGGIGIGALTAPAIMGSIAAGAGLRVALVLPPCLLAVIALVSAARLRLVARQGPHCGERRRSRADERGEVR